MCYFSIVGFWFFCFKQKTAYELRISDWSSDVCSSDLEVGADVDQLHGIAVRVRRGRGSIATCCCAGWGTMHAVWRSGCRASDARPWVRWLSGFAGVDGDVRNAACDGSREARPQGSRLRTVRRRGRDRSTPPWAIHGPRSEEHTSELQSLMRTSYAVFCLKKKKPN